jgi:hypothetical protein
MKCPHEFGDLTAWETLIVSVLEGDVNTRGEKAASRDALKCLRMLFALEQDPAHRAVLYGLIGLGEDIIEEMSATGPEMVLAVHQILKEFERVAAEGNEVTITAMHAVWGAALVDWNRFASSYCKLACELMNGREQADANECAAPIEECRLRIQNRES